MAKEHGLMPEHYESWDESFDWSCFFNVDCGFNISSRDEKIYIRSDCHEMLKPQVGDLGMYEQLGEYSPVQFINSYTDKGNYWADSECIEMEGDCKIIQRNGKTFFMPEVEDA